VHLPTVDDETLFRVLEKLLVLDGQRLSYRALDVEQIGSVYEALMGYHVLRVASEAVCMKPDRLWVSAEEVLAVPATRRAKWLKDTIGVTPAQAEKLSAELDGDASHGVLEALTKFAAGGRKNDPSLSKAKAGQLVLQPGTERRRTSSHYTPRSLSAPIVQRTLEPLLAVMGKEPASERILNLKVCDPAMGSGAFLVEACRYLADQVFAAWTREHNVEAIAAEHGDPLLHARRLVAQRCLYGVDKNDAAVELAKLSLWLVTLSRTLPFTFLDHCLRHGDSLVGLDFDQIRNFHWKRPEKEASPQLELFGREITVALDEAIALRQKIGELGDSPGDDREKARLFWDAQDALDRVKLIGDLVVGAFFAHEKDKDREAERARREEMVRAWLGAGEPPPEDLLGMQREIRATAPVFHWMADFPEVFYAGRPDPLEANQVNRAAFMDAFVGNPPFMGGGQISGTLGTGYRDWLLAVREGVHGNGDLCAHFFRACVAMLGSSGTLGLVATSSISQGDTRESGLKHITAAGGRIYDATTSLRWGGDANVIVSVVHVAVGSPAKAVASRLDGVVVANIDSSLRAAAERPSPTRLVANHGLASKGFDIGGLGFTLSRDEREDLVARDPKNASRIFPYVGGEDVNSSPEQGSDRFVIDFGTMSLEEAAAWPDLLGRVTELVKPGRDANKRDTYRTNWWLFAERRPGLLATLGDAKRCLVAARVTKHLAVSFQPTNRVLNEKLYVFPFDSHGNFAVLQCRLHERWARYLSSDFGSSSIGAVLAYAASDCFETFPFPRCDPRTVLPALEDIGQRLYDLRAAYMVDEKVGLTITYNRLKDPSCTDARILELRGLHEEMDRKVLEAYAEGDPEGRWLEIAVPPFCPWNDEDAKKLAAFEDAVIDRLFLLNAKRAEEERLKGLGASGSKPKRVAPSPARSPRRARGKPATDQLALTSSDPDAES